MRILLQGAKVYWQKQLLNVDIALHNGRIFSIEPSISSKNGFDCVYSFPSSFVITPGFVDVHVHLREPGFSYKETIHSGTMAAAAGGYTALCAMPNLDPVPDTKEHLEAQLTCIQKDACIHVYPYGTLTKGRKGTGVPSDFAALQSEVIGYSDDGTGVQDEALMKSIMQSICTLGKPIAAHCEVDALLQGGVIHKGEYASLHGHKGISSESEYAMVERDLRLVKETGCRYHVCHVSTKESVALIRKAKKEGLPVSAETAPHYLLLTDQDLQEDGRYKMNPPLRGKEDREALLAGLLDGTIDVIATDHAPHASSEKAKGLDGSAMGITGLETAFPVLYTYLVKENKIPLSQLLEKMIDAPRKLFSIPQHFSIGDLFEANILDLNCPHTLDAKKFLSMGKATPFDGFKVLGKNRMTWVNGNLIWSDLER